MNRFKCNCRFIVHPLARGMAPLDGATLRQIRVSDLAQRDEDLARSQRLHRGENLNEAVRQRGGRPRIPQNRKRTTGWIELAVGAWSNVRTCIRAGRWAER